MRSLCIIFLLILSICSIYSQDIIVDKDGFETFSMIEGDTSYTMKKYFMAFLNEGPNRDHTVEEAAKIQAGHLAHMDKLAKKGIINIAGPFADDGLTKGIAIYAIPTLEEALEITKKDPAVKAGRLIVEIRPWWAAMGSTLK